MNENKKQQIEGYAAQIMMESHGYVELETALFLAERRFRFLNQLKLQLNPLSKGIVQLFRIFPKRYINRLFLNKEYKQLGVDNASSIGDKMGRSR